jgi:uncharacterized membrane protein
MDSLIKPDQVWLLWAIIFSGVALSIWLEQTYSWAAKVSGPVVALCMAMGLSNLHLMPTTTKVAVRDEAGDRVIEVTKINKSLSEAEVVRRVNEYLKKQGKSPLSAEEIKKGDSAELLEKAGVTIKKNEILSEADAARRVNEYLEKQGKSPLTEEQIEKGVSDDQLDKAGVTLLKTEGVYEVVEDYLVPLALPLLLFRANLVHIVRSTKWLFLAVNIAALGSMIGAVVASAMYHSRLEKISDLAGIMTASYVGGAVNFNAVVRTYKTESSLTAPLIVADNFVMAGAFLVILMIVGSKWMHRWFPHPHTKDSVDSRKLAAEHWRAKEISLLDIVSALAVATGVLAIAQFTKGEFEKLIDPKTLVGSVVTNRFVHITAWSTLIATLGHRWLKRVRGTEEMGAVLLYTFLFVIGLPANFIDVIQNTPLMFVFCLVICVFNIGVTLLLGWVFRLDIEHLGLAMNATLGGPPTAAAMAISKGWSDLVLPGLLIGLWGYTIGTATGLLVGELVKDWFM